MLKSDFFENIPENAILSEISWFEDYYLSSKSYSR